MLTMMPMSGSAICASSAIWPRPRIAISRTSTSVPLGALRISSGRPISVLKFARLATVRRCGVRIALRRSLVDVLPVEPVTPMTWGLMCRRHPVASCWRAFSGSGVLRTGFVGCSACAVSAYRSVVRTPHAPASSACVANRPPSALAPFRPMNSAPGPAARESMTTVSGPFSAAGEEISCAPAARAMSSGLHSCIRAESTHRCGDQMAGVRASAAASRSDASGRALNRYIGSRVYGQRPTRSISPIAFACRHAGTSSSSVRNISQATRPILANPNCSIASRTSANQGAEGDPGTAEYVASPIVHVNDLSRRSSSNQRVKAC